MSGLWNSLCHGAVARLIGVSLLLLLVVQAAGFAVVRDTIERNVRAQVTHSLEVDANIWQHLLDQNHKRLHQAAVQLVSDGNFRAATALEDLSVIQLALDNHTERVGAVVTALLDHPFNLRSISVAPLPVPGMEGFEEALKPMLPTLLPALLQAQQTLQAPQQGRFVAVVQGLPYQFILVPIKVPEAGGWILMGLPIHQAMADQMQQLVSAQLALRVRSPDGVWTVPLSTLPPNLLGLLEQHTGPITELIDPDTTFLAQCSPLTHALREAAPYAEVVLLRPLGAVAKPYLRLQAVLALITFIGLLLVAVGTGWVARRVIAPLHALVQGTQRLARGQYDIPIEHTKRRDEIGDLARSFDHMRTSIAAQQTEIRHLAYWDRLTGLPNRERFRDIVIQAISAHSAHTVHPLAVITLDLDRFKHVNDVLGYAFGDQLLQAVAIRLRQQVSDDTDVVARLGGNEFALLLGSADGAAALEVAQRIADAFEAPMAFGDQTVDLSAGIGIACWPVDADNVDTLLGHSEVAMYAAKRRLNGPQLYDAALDSSSTQTLSLLTELRRAVEQNELRLYLQPKVALQGQLGLAAESLLRWQHPHRGLVPPGEFIPFAEQTGFIRQLTLWVFDAVACLLSDVRARNMGLRISVNLSTRDLLDPDLSLRLGTMLERHGVQASSFCLEITESAIMDDPQRAEAMLNRLAQQGFKLSIDDFGTGYSSLGYLKRLPVDELKIDRSFVMGMESDENDATIVRSTIDLAHNLGLSVVAEGVENAAILEQLRALACDEAQGYHISRPMPIEAFFAWYAHPLTQN